MIDRTIQMLIVDDDPGLLAVLECGLAQQPDYQVRAVDTAGRALQELRSRPWDLLITDYALDDPQVNGIELLRASRNLEPAPLAIIITAFASLQITLESINLGAHNFLTKPFQLDELFLVVRNAVATIHLRRENRALAEQTAHLDRALQTLELQQRQLMERIRNLEYEGGVADDPEGRAVAALNSAQSIELRRRRMRDQVAAYLRAGEGIERALAEQRDRHESIVRPGRDG